MKWESPCLWRIDGVHMQGGGVGCTGGAGGVKLERAMERGSS